MTSGFGKVEILELYFSFCNFDIVFVIIILVTIILVILSLILSLVMIILMMVVPIIICLNHPALGPTSNTERHFTVTTIKTGDEVKPISVLLWDGGFII